MKLEAKMMEAVSATLSRRTFLARTLKMGAATGFTLAGLGSILAEPALAITSCTGMTTSTHCQCTACNAFCTGCNGAEGSNGCPAGYSQYNLCGYANPSCWCTPTCCIKRGTTYYHCHRVCCDCVNNLTSTEICTCQNAWSCGTKCGAAEIHALTKSVA